MKMNVFDDHGDLYNIELFFNLLKKKNNILCELLKWHSESNCLFAGYAKIASELSVLGKKKKPRQICKESKE